MNSDLGCVYFFKHKGLKPIKIGFTNNYSPISRLKQFNTYAPYGVELIGYFQVKNASIIERELHKKYSKNRLNGEWFDISIEDATKEISKYNKDKKIKKKWNDCIFNELFDNIPLNKKISNKDFYNNIYKEIKIKVTKKKIIIELKKYCIINKIQFKTYNSNGFRSIILEKTTL